MSGADGYRIYVDNNSGFGTPEINTTSSVSSLTSYTSLDNNVYYWKVQAYDGGENGPWSSVREFVVDTPPGPPVQTDPGSGASYNIGDTVTFMWNAPTGVPDVERYYLRIVEGTDLNATPVYEEELSGTSRSVPLSSGTWDGGVHTWGVRAIKTAPPGYDQLDYESAIGWGGYSTRTFTIASTPEQGTISGVARDITTDDPLPGVSVVLKQSGEIQYPTDTDEVGYYIIGDIDPGTYTLEAAKSGYYTWTESITFNEGENQSGHDIQMTPVNLSFLSGTVHDGDTNTPIDDAMITLTSGAIEYSDYTKDGGGYSISGIVPNTYLLTINKEGYETRQEDINIQASSNLIRNYDLYPTQQTGDPVVNSISTRYPGHVYFLEGVSKFVTFNVTVDWAGHLPHLVRFITPIAQYDVSTDNNHAEKEINVGEFSSCSDLFVQALGEDGSVSEISKANITIMQYPPFVPALESIDLAGDSFKYADSIGFRESFFDEGIEGVDIPQDIPLFGNKKFKLKWIPSLRTEVTSTGEARYELDWNNSNFVEGEMAGFEYGLYPGLELNGFFYDLQCAWDWAGYIEANGRIKKSFTWPFLVPTPIGPIPLYFKIGLEAIAEIGLGIEGLLDPESLDPITLNGRIDVDPKLRGSLGAGLDQRISGEGWVQGRADLGLQWPDEPTLDDLSIIFSAGFTAYCFLLHWEWEGFYREWDFRKGEYLLDISLLDDVEPKLVSRDYLNAINYGKFIGSDVNLKQKIEIDDYNHLIRTVPIQENVFPYTEAYLSASDNILDLVWLYDDPNRSSMNRTMAVFSRWNDNEWTEPESIDDDGTADFHPRLLSFNNGNIFACWENINQIMPDEAVFEDMLENMDISVARYDSQSSEWSSALHLSDNLTLDSSPLIDGPSDDNVMVVWINNPANDIRGSQDNPNEIWYSLWNGNEWSEPQFAAEIGYGLVKYNLVFDGLNAYLAMSLDIDGIDDSTDDHELFSLAYTNGSWQGLTQLTDDNIVDDNPQLHLDSDNNLLMCWIKGSEISSTLNLNMVDRDVIMTDETGYTANLADFKMAYNSQGIIAIVWAEPAEYNSDLFAVLYDPFYGVWSNPRQLTSDIELEQQITVAFLGATTLNIVYNKVVVEEEVIERVTPVGKTIEISIPRKRESDLFTLQYILGDDLKCSMDGIVSNPGNPHPASSITLSLNIVNDGDQAIGNIPVGFYLGNPAEGGSQIGMVSYDDILVPGEMGNVSIQWVVPDTSIPLDVYAIIDPHEVIDDLNRVNNITNVKIIQSDMEITNVRWEQAGPTYFEVVAHVINSGVIPNEICQLKLINNTSLANLLDTITIPSIQPGLSNDFVLNFELSEIQEHLVSVSAIVDADEMIDDYNRDNNYRILGLDESAPLISDIDDDFIVEGVPYTGTLPLLILGTDPITWSLTSGPIEMSIEEITGITSWIYPEPGGSPYLVEVNASNFAGSDEEEWLLTVYPDNEGDNLPDYLDDDDDNDGMPDDFEILYPEALDPFADDADDDFDGDGLTNIEEFSLQTDPTSSDTDDDSITDLSDNCRLIFNPEQADFDEDDIGDLCDNCPGVMNTSQTDEDGDGFGSLCECDDDSAGINPCAIDICEDQVDQDCTGYDLSCTAIAEIEPNDDYNINMQDIGILENNSVTTIAGDLQHENDLDHYLIRLNGDGFLEGVLVFDCQTDVDMLLLKHDEIGSLLNDAGSSIFRIPEKFTQEVRFLEVGDELVLLINGHQASSYTIELLFGYCTDDDSDNYPDCACFDEPCDCNDNNSLIYPGAEELCNGLDDNCDDILGEDEVDNDDDSYLLCNDCDDENDQVYPGHPEECNGIDDNCNGNVDEGCPPGMCGVGIGHTSPLKRGNISYIYFIFPIIIIMTILRYRIGSNK